LVSDFHLPAPLQHMQFAAAGAVHAFILAFILLEHTATYPPCCPCDLHLPAPLPHTSILPSTQSAALAASPHHADPVLCWSRLRSWAALAATCWGEEKLAAATGIPDWDAEVSWG
jgi:hypothetical protein